MKMLKVFCIVFIIFYNFTFSNAIDSSIYFKKVFDTYDIDLNFIEDFSSFIPQYNKIYLIKSSNLDITSFEGFSDGYVHTIIVICDTHFTINSDLSCDSFSLTAEDIYKYEFSPSQYIGFQTINNSRLIFVPEALLIDRDIQPKLMTYFQSLFVISNVSPGVSLGDIVRTWLLPWVGLLSSLILVLLFSIVTYLLVIKHSFSSVFLFLKPLLFPLNRKYIYIFTTLFLVTFFSYTSLIIFKYKEFNIVSIYSSLKYIFDINTLHSFIAFKSYAKILFIVWLYFLLLLNSLMGLYVSYLFLNLLRTHFYEKIHLSKNIGTGYLFLSISLFLLAPFLFDNRLFVILLTLDIVILIFHFKEGILAQRYISKVLAKYLSIIFSFILLFYMGLSYKGYFKFGDTSNYYLSIFEEKNILFLLPVEVSVSDTARYLDYLIRPGFPLFVNDLLIYHPNYRYISNKPIEYFNPSTDYIVVGKQGQSYLSNLLKGTLPLEWVYSDRPTNLFSVNSSKKGTLRFKFIFDCSASPGDFKLSLFGYSIVGGELKTTSIDLLNFPGCDTEDVEVFFYKDIFDLYQLYSIKEDAFPYIKNIEVYSLERDLELTYFKTPTYYTILHSFLENNSEALTVYSLDTETTFDSTYIGDLFNLGESLNKILDNQLVSGKLTLWTDTPFGIVYRIVN